MSDDYSAQLNGFQQLERVHKLQRDMIAQRNASLEYDETARRLYEDDLATIADDEKCIALIARVLANSATAERERNARFLELKARQHEEAATDIERQTFEEGGIGEEAQMHRIEADGLRRIADDIRTRKP